MSLDQTAAGRAPLAVPSPMFDAPLREPRNRERFIPQTKNRQKKPRRVGADDSPFIADSEAIRPHVRFATKLVLTIRSGHIKLR
ncbi:hypothetical protein [Paraburkholderia sp. HD33-4]|uniref:hypothetical protein n=1 Tax=Paraburkholderia sp. HD33-4 TaxID=2883242 RepID=UPI001F1BE30D|nr:hypothetical protein [Paraburkholderia sp. HD33-4]